MDEVIVVEDRVDAQCRRHVHLMSNIQYTSIDIPYPPDMWMGNCEAGVWHYRADYPYRGVLDIGCIYDGGNFRRLVVWSLDGYELIKVALHDAWNEYVRLFQGAPQHAFIKKLPSIVPNGHEVGGMTLVEAEWMMDCAVAVGRRG